MPQAQLSEQNIKKGLIVHFEQTQSQTSGNIIYKESFQQGLRLKSQIKISSQ